MEVPFKMAANVKILVLAAKLTIFNEFSKFFLRLICLTSLQLTFLDFCKKNQVYKSGYIFAKIFLQTLNAQM
jgi:hypothetical protein